MDPAARGIITKVQCLPAPRGFPGARSKFDGKSSQSEGTTDAEEKIQSGRHGYKQIQQSTSQTGSFAKMLWRDTCQGCKKGFARSAHTRRLFKWRPEGSWQLRFFTDMSAGFWFQTRIVLGQSCICGSAR